MRSREKKVSKRKQKKRRAGKVLSPGGYRPIYYRGYIVDKQIVILFIRMNEKKWLKKYCSNIQKRLKYGQGNCKRASKQAKDLGIKNYTRFRKAELFLNLFKTPAVTPL